MDLAKLKEMASGVPAFLKEQTPALLKEQASVLLTRLSSLADKILESPLGDRLFGHFPEEKRRPMVFGFGGAVIFLLVLIIVLAISSGGSRAAPPPDAITAAGLLAEQLFIPAEPDFIPEFLLEREPRRFWTIEDIRPYWRVPGYPELWRNEISSVVDTLMEGVR
ncbi:MAG: hypothetical protein FWH19_04140 [Treponema sp.]|nr:hypothetical protein [Treponema sp.]